MNTEIPNAGNEPEKIFKTDAKTLAKNKRWRDKNREVMREHQRAYAERNKEELARRLREKRQNDPAFNELCKERSRISSRNRFRKYRLEVYNALGGPVCASCGTEDIRVLCVHHINGGGNSERQDITKHAYVKKLIECANQAPSELQVLCLNCHAIKHYND